MKTGIRLRRILMIIMCLCLLTGGMGCLFDAIATNVSVENPTEVRAAKNDNISVDEPTEVHAAQDDYISANKSTEVHAAQDTNEDIKAQLLRQITEDGWDPYSENMTIEEFYALMEMAEEGMLPVDNANTAAISAYSALGNGKPYAGEPSAVEASGILVPRTMFLLSGLTADNILDNYDNDNGSEGENYPPNLDRYGVGYKLPPADWNGVGVTEDKNTGALRAAVIVDGINDENPNVAGDVNQELFPKIDGYYVRSVSAEGVGVSILGVIQKSDGEYVYYYMSTADQSTLVSSTTLPSNAKFIINYCLNEHEITYEIEMADNSTVPAHITLDSVFGATRPTKTVDAAYSFDVIAPYGYTVQVFRKTKGGGDKVELTGNEQINNGYPLGTEPVYTLQNGKQVPDTGSGPSAMTRNATFYNNLVTEDRTVVAVLTKGDAPVFNAYNLLPKIDNTKGRGTSAFYKVKAKDKDGNEITVPYDYEDVYEWANGRASKYDYVESSITSGGASKGNVKDGNVATADKWGWDKDVDVTNDAKMDYDEEADSYSYQWTFQTNSSSGGYTLDTLEINGVAIRIPYLPKQTRGNNETTGAEGGIRTWFTEGTLPDGAAVRVEFLMSFNNNPQQRVYRIIVTGAHSNVTLTNMNLMQGTGAPEMSVYNLVGVHADTGNTTSQLPMIEYYTAAFETIPANQWYKGNLADVLVRQPNWAGDDKNHGANIRFKLADGYGEPFYLYESYLGNVIAGQASAQRMADGVTFDNAKSVQPLPEDDSVHLESQYIYGPDDEGWYYIRLTTQEDNINKFALLTIIARPVKYVVRYMTGENFPADEEKGLEERSPENMPRFDHTNSDSSFQESLYGWQYDDNNGFYYDTVNNPIIAITSVAPNDPKSWYKFVDWVIVDAEGNPVQRQSTSQTVSLYSGEPEGEEEIQDNSIHITSSRALNVNDVNEYSIENDGLGGNAVSVHVIRLMPTWKKVINPFKYSVVVDWVDSLGELHQEHFDGYWDDILTDSPDKDLTVFVNKDAEPLQRWLAEHPTYGFWDEVNNAVDDKNYVPPVATEPPESENSPEPTESPDPDRPKSAKDKIEASMNELYPELAKRVDAAEEGSLYNRVLNALLEMDIGGDIDSTTPNQPDTIDDFSRLGGYAFSVHQNGGKIAIWMCEKKSGLEIRSELKGDALIDNEEIYYTFNAVSGGLPLEGIYKVYPEGFVGENGTRMILDEYGNPRILMDTDAWLVKFENGTIADIIHNNGEEWHTGATGDERVRYFAAKHNGDPRQNKGIILYAPVGDYIVTQAGSKSGGAYNVKLDYYDWTDVTDPRLPPFRFVDIYEPEGEQWTWGKNTEYIPKTVDGNFSQVSPEITYNEGSNNRLYVIQFTNRTSTLVIGNEVNGITKDKTEFNYKVKLNLPENVKPLWEEGDDENPGYYYFNYKLYDVEYPKATSVPKATENPAATAAPEEDNAILTNETSGMIKLTEITDDDPDGFNWTGTVTVLDEQRMKITLSVPEQNLSESDVPASDAPMLMDLEESVPEEPDPEPSAAANYSVHELGIPEKYILENIETIGSSMISVAGSNASGMLSAVDNHSITFIHKRDIALPDAGAPGVMLFGIFGVLLLAAAIGLCLMRRKAL